MSVISSIFFFAAVLLFSLPVHADVFQYFDQDGTLIITDTLHPADRPRVLRDRASKGIKTEFKEGIYYEYYPVSGNNFHELVSSAGINGYYDASEGKIFPAVTKWNMGWTYKIEYSYEIADSSVRVSMNIFSVDFKSDITVVLPIAAENTVLSSADLKLWNGFVQELIAHEHDHVKIIRDGLYQDKALKAIAGLKELILPYEPNADIDDLIKKSVEEETGRIGHALIKEIKGKNDEYDRLTGHGLRPKMREVFFGR